MRIFLFLSFLLMSLAVHAKSNEGNRLPEPQLGHHILEIGANSSIWLLPGFSGETIFSDIYEFTGKGWQKKMTMPFTDRTWYSANYLPDYSQIMLFGGKTMDRKPFDETWIWDGKKFAKHKGITPPARSHHTATYDPYRKVVVVFGGDANENLLNDIWEWNGSDWKQVKLDGEQPEPRAAHMAAYDPNSKSVIVVGGVHSDNKTRYRDAWAWDGKKWKRLHDLPNPLAAAAMGNNADGVLLVGGWSKGFESVNQVHQLADSGWELINQDFGARSFSSVSYLENKGKLILSGGMGPDFKPKDDIHMLSKDP